MCERLCRCGSYPSIQGLLLHQRGPLRAFLLPGGHGTAQRLHLLHRLYTCTKSVPQSYCTARRTYLGRCGGLTTVHDTPGADVGSTIWQMSGQSDCPSEKVRGLLKFGATGSHQREPNYFFSIPLESY